MLLVRDAEKGVWIAALALLASIEGCGAKVVVDAASMGTGRGNGGAGGASPGTGGASVTSSVSTSGEGGGGITVSAVASTVGSSSSSGAPGTCPLLAPNDGDPCSDEGLTCQVPLCCAGSAVCTSGAWRVASAPCGLPCIPCNTRPTQGAPGCSVGAVCVYDLMSGPVAVGHCARDLCAPGMPACGCAAPLCGDAGYAQVMGATVECNASGG